MISVMYFLSGIFISMVIIVFNEIITVQKKKNKKSVDDIMKEEHTYHKIK